MSINLSSMETSVNVPNKQEYRCFHNVLASNIFNCKFNLDDCIGDQVEVATEYHWSCVNYGKNTRIHCETLVLFTGRIFAVSIEYLPIELHKSSCVCFAILLETCCQHHRIRVLHAMWLFKMVTFNVNTTRRTGIDTISNGK